MAYMKKVISWMSVVLSFCIMIPKSNAAQMSQFSTIKQDTLVVGTYFTNPPFEFIKEGKRVGFEVDLLNAICQRLKLKCEFVDTTWEGILTRLENQQYDAIVGGITITEERSKTLNFSIPYMTTTLSVLIDQRSSSSIQSLGDLKGKTIGVQAETTDQDIAQKMLKENQIAKMMVYPFANMDQAISDLEKGVIDAFFKVFPVAYYLAKTDSSLRVVAQIPNDPQPLGIAFNKKNSKLLEAFNQALKNIQEDGTYQTIYHKWFPKTP